MVTSPPYDLVTPEERRLLITSSPYNVVRLTLPTLLPGDLPGDQYKRAASYLRVWLRRGVLRLEGEAVYGYQMTWNGRVVRGVLAAVPLEGLLPHEATKGEVVAERLALMEATLVNAEPIYLLGPKGLDQAIPGGKTLARTSRAGVEHHLWRLDDASAAERALAGEPLLVADGHHRLQTARLFHETHRGREGPPVESSRCLAFVTAEGAPFLLPHHRVLKNVDPRFFLKTASRLGRVAPAARNPHRLAQQVAEARTEGRAYGVILKDESYLAIFDGKLEGKEGGPARRRLDLVVLEEVLLPELAPGSMLLPRATPAAAATEVAEGRAEIAILLAPPTVSEVRAVALEGSVFPAKATYFLPKPLTGLVMRALTWPL